MQKSMVLFNFSVSPEIPFLGKFCPKYQNHRFKLKFGTETNVNMQNSMVMLIFSVFDRKYPFWANLVQNIKIVKLSWNLIPTVIFIIFLDFLCFTKFFFHLKWNHAQLLRINMVYTSCLTSCQTTKVSKLHRMIA